MRLSVHRTPIGNGGSKITLSLPGVPLSANTHVGPLELPISIVLTAAAAIMKTDAIMSTENGRKYENQSQTASQRLELQLREWFIGCVD